MCGSQPMIVLTSELPVVVVNDAAMVVGEPSDDEDDEEAVALERELTALADAQRTDEEGTADVDAP